MKTDMMMRAQLPEVAVWTKSPSLIVNLRDMMSENLIILSGAYLVSSRQSAS